MTGGKRPPVILVSLIVGLSVSLVVLTLSCSPDVSEAPSDPVSVARIRTGEKVNGECLFDDASTKYPVTYSGITENCMQAVSIGPLALAELEQMKRDVPSFWENSSPYRQALVGEMIDGTCDFSSPAVQAYLQFSETVSTDWANCVMIVDVGPATEKQVEEVQRFGSRSAEAAVPAPSEPVPGQ